VPIIISWYIGGGSCIDETMRMVPRYKHNKERTVAFPALGICLQNSISNDMSSHFIPPPVGIGH
jgi:hypothetical protein